MAVGLLGELRQNLRAFWLNYRVSHNHRNVEKDLRMLKGHTS